MKIAGRGMISRGGFLKLVGGAAGAAPLASSPVAKEERRPTRESPEKRRRASQRSGAQRIKGVCLLGRSRRLRRTRRLPPASECWDSVPGEMASFTSPPATM